MKKALILSLVMSFFICNAVKAQGNTYQDKATLNLNEVPAVQNRQLADSLFLWQERIELHLDKTKVQPSDYVFFKAYLLTGPKRLRVSASEVLKVELLDDSGNLLKSQYHRIEDGMADGSFKIPKKLKTGNYFFRTYTQWMLNYGSEQLAKEKLFIGRGKGSAKGRAEEPIEVTAFPEGGHLVAGLKNRLVIKSATDHVTGLEILDESGNTVAPITSYGNIGTTIFEPKIGRSYYVAHGKQKIYKISQVERIGYTLQVNNLETDKAVVRVETSSERLGIPMILKGRSDDVTYFETKVDFQENTITQVEITKEEIPSGVLDVVLVDEADNIWAQRPLIVDREEFRITVSNLQSASNEGDQQTLLVKVTDAEGRPVETSLSVSLTAIEKGSKDLTASSFKSEVDKSFRNRRFADDLSLLASKLMGETTDFGNAKPMKEIRYGFQKGLDFFGQAYDLNENVLRNTRIQVAIFPEDQAIAEEVTTNSEGLFKLSALNFTGEAKVVFRTVGENTKEKLVKVVPYENETPPLEEDVQMESLEPSESKVVEKNVSRRTAADFLAEEEEGLINLDEVTLVADKTERKLAPSHYGITPSRTIIQNSEWPRTLPQMFLNLPGFNVVDLGGLNPRLVLPRSAGMGPLLWVIDGFPIEQTNSLRDIISIVPHTDVERIEILLGPSAAAYGSRAAGAVILIYTRSGSDEEYFSRKHTQLTYNGYHESLDFSSYKGETIPSFRKLKNNDATLYWNPNLDTDANGEARIRLAVPDAFNKFRLGIKAISQSGKRANVETLLSF
ncbi:MAG: TonB-dependent receptor plug domain-containing protein [Flavobacteriaceae bacterium]